MAKDAYRYFRVEARELLEQLGRAALELERGAEAAQAVARLLRLAHTLKGAARVVRQREIADHAHAIEEALGPLRDSAQAPPPGLVDALLARLDGIGAGIDALAPAADDAPAAAPGPAAPEPSRSVRADVEDVDLLLGGIARAHGGVAALRRELDATARACGLAQMLAEQLVPRRTRGAALVADPRHALAEELRAVLADAQRSLLRSAERADRELRWVRDSAEQLRLVPAAALFASLERAARDDARALGKQVVFAAHGGAVRLDAGVLEAMQGALLQLVRNAVAHGIEPPAERRDAGKTADGRITLDVARRGRHWVFRCGDDGAGVDLDAVRRAAQRKGWLASSGPALDAQALLQLMLRGGLSTASRVTEVAGRGIGLDVVRDAVARLGGAVEVRTTRGQGTQVELSMPMSVASFEALLVEVGGRTLAIPLAAVRLTLRRDAREIARTAQGASLSHEGEAIAFAWLSQLIDGRPPARAGAVSAVLLESVAGRAVIGVDRLLGTAHVVQHALPELAPAAATIAGASLDAEGNPRLVLDPDNLVARARARDMDATTHEEGAKPPPGRVLVIDDSLTTRMLEKSILESAGYLVHTAASAEEGLEQARRERYALFLVDVEMPGMDGFAFVERTGADPSLRDTPAILVTSRSAPEDRQRGMQAGARGYIVKSEFAQNDFLRQVRELVAEP